jgi:hypothetical protein
MRELVKDLELNCEKEGDLFRITILTEQPALARMIRLLSTMQELAEELQHHVKRTESQLRADIIVQQDHAARVALVKMYQALRKNGVKHRAAIELVSKSPLAYQSRYGKAEINWAVKAYRTEMGVV